MSEHRTGTGTRIGTGTGTGTKLEMGILRVALVIPKFEHGTKFQESQESVCCDSGASRVDEFWGRTSARGVMRRCDRFVTSQDLSAKSHQYYGM